MAPRDKVPADASAKQRPAAAKRAKQSGSIARHLAFVFLAAALAGIATHGGATRLVYTVDERRPNADCLLVKRDRIAATGTLESVQAEWDIYQTELIHKFYGGEPKAKKPLQVIRPPSGSIIVPGLADAHAHLMLYGAKMQLNLEGAESIDEVLDRVESYVTRDLATPGSEIRWVEGFGWDQTRWKNWRGGFPSKSDLASRPALAGIPIALSRVDVHALWVSARALELAEASLPGGRWPGSGEIEGGEVMKDEKGEPTGVLVDSAMGLIPVPPPSEAQMTKQLERAVSDALAVGLTSVHDAAVSGQMLDVFKKMADDGRLPIRIYAMANEESSEYWGGRFKRLEDYGRDGRLNLRSVKLFTDGGLKQTVAKFWEDGWGVNIHCIGDRANKAVLDIFESLLQGNESAPQRRPRIEHAQIMRLLTSDMWYAESRLSAAQILHSLPRSSPNKVLPLGSDFPVEGINPLLGFYAAVSRLDVRGESPHGSGGWFPSERLTRAQALKGMTYDAAFASFAEEDLGSLSAGKRADYVVLDTNIMNEEGAFADILTAQVRATVVDGQILYGGI
ncbi:amidohydrolase family-domain-containing protein [Fomitopsis serialis]|uniref:amidohydrolase family-domain-containing protein n=1 Tax=Fomitopsis serialis TaxID=139415 RepID=UPI0020089B69|nr:amidohydrolase family-domain-containing protein [Neoantrodia serialis]KAH9921109.1 amidohydrolase family-domain-containing protein [Neoantrodia serialis]